MKLEKLISILFFVFISTLLFSQNDTTSASLKKHSDLRDYVFKNVMYPKKAIESNIQGVVKYKIKITSEGCYESIIILDSPDKLLDKAVEKVLKDTKCNWKPATIDGKPVDSWLYSDVRFIMM